MYVDETQNNILIVYTIWVIIGCLFYFVSEKLYLIYNDKNVLLIVYCII